MKSIYTDICCYYANTPLIYTFYGKFECFCQVRFLPRILSFFFSSESVREIDHIQIFKKKFHFHTIILAQLSGQKALIGNLQASVN